MKGCLIFLSITFFAIVMIGCLPDDLTVGKIPQLKPKIVVSSQITSDRSLVISLTKSVGALDVSDDIDPAVLLLMIEINDATITVYHDGDSYPLQRVEHGVYTSDVIPLTVGDTYQLKVESPSMGVVTSETALKGLVMFESVEVNDALDGPDEWLRYSFQDPAGKNFYMVNVQRFSRTYEPEYFINPAIYTHLIKDDQFEQELKAEDLKITGLEYPHDLRSGDSALVVLSNISEEYFHFMELRLDSRHNFSDFLAEPGNYPTNIQGGLGFFNLYLPDARILVVGDK